MATCTVPGDFATIALAVASAGCDTILVSPGTYAGFAPSAVTSNKLVIGTAPGVIVTGTVTTGGSGNSFRCRLENMTLQAGVTVGGGALQTEIVECTLNGTAGSSSCISVTDTTIIEDIIISTASATYGIIVQNAAGELTINGTNTVNRLSGTGTGAIRLLNNKPIIINGSVDVTGLWTNALIVETTGGTVTGTGSITASSQTIVTGINCQAGSVTFGRFDFVGSTPTTGTGIRCSAGSVEIELSGSLDRTQRGIWVSGSGSTVTVSRMSIGATTGHFHGVFAETSGRATLYGCTIENCIGQVSNDGSAVNVITGADVVMDSKESEDHATTIINRIENCSSATNQDGGAIAVNGSGSTCLAYALRVIGCTALGTGSGGAIRVEAGGVLTLGRLVNETDGIAGENGAVSYAGWDAFDSGRVDQGGCIISGCSGLDGGAISVDASTATVVNARLRDNTARRATALTAGQGGGGIEMVSSTVTCHICLFDGNATAGAAGGAIHQSGGTLLVTKTTLDANSAANGSHLYIATGTATIHDDILINAPQGYGIYKEAAASLDMITNCLFENLPDHVSGAGIGTSDVHDPSFCPVAEPDGTDPSEFDAYRLSGSSSCASMGTRSSDFGADDPLLIPVTGSSGVACGRWQDVIAPTVQEDCEIRDCDYQTYAGPYDADWAAMLEKPTGADHRAIVCLDPGGLNYQLTGMLASMRPLTTQRDVKFQEYQGQDCDLEFIDPEGTLDPEVPGSSLEGVNWRGMKLFIGSWLVGTQRVLGHAIFYLDDIRAAEGVVRFRAKDAFSRLQDTQVRANIAIDQADTAAGGSVSVINVHVDFAAIESWTLTFTTATHFKSQGSLTGADGEGDTTSDFTSTSGSISIPASSWSGTFAAGDEVTFIAVAQYGPGNLFAICRQILTDNTDLESSDFDDETWNDAIASFASHVGTWTQRDATDALSLLRLFMRHGPATAYPDHEGQIAIAHFLPRLGSVIDRTICDTYDLEDLDTERLNIHTSVTVRFAPDATGELTLSRRWPQDTGLGNFPLTVDLPGFGADDESIVDFVAQRYFALFEEQRELFNVDLLLQDLNRKLEDVAYLRSTLPRRTTYGQFIKLERDLVGLQIRAQLLDAGWLIQPAGSCGTMFYDAGHRYDDCWTYW